MANWTTLRKQKKPKTDTPIAATSPATHTATAKIIQLNVAFEIIVKLKKENIVGLKCILITPSVNAFFNLGYVLLIIQLVVK
jgi:hypothetical protein